MLQFTFLQLFRNTDYMHKDVVEQRTLDEGTKPEEIGSKLRLKNFKIESTEGNTIVFNGGTYDLDTRLATYTKKELPYVLKKMTDMHKATSDRPLFFLNIFFGVSLLFFVISSFWMFLPGTSIFKKGMYFTAAGLLLALLIIFI